MPAERRNIKHTQALPRAAARAVRVGRRRRAGAGYTLCVRWR